MNSLVKIFKVAAKFEKYADEHVQSWQPGDYAKRLKGFLGIKSNDEVDLNSPPINAIYEVIGDCEFKGSLKVTLGLTTSKEVILNVDIITGSKKQLANLTKGIRVKLLPPIKTKLNSLPAPLEDYLDICSVDISAE